MFYLPHSIPAFEDPAAVLGGKGAGLVFMKANGINVPPFVIFPVETWKAYRLDPRLVMKVIEEESLPVICEYFKSAMGYMPLLSVRSGAKFSMPGMMDTILNVGLTPQNTVEWSDRVGDKCMVDSVKRLNHMYKDVVGVTCPDTLEAQLLGAIEAVFKSWDNERGVAYRTLNNIDHNLGTACVLQAMVFGNLNDKSGTGVLFTRNPSTGANEVLGEFLVNAQGEDVVAGTRTPMPLSQMSTWNSKVALELADTVEKLEVLKRDMQDVEFTIQDGVLFILQTRDGKRTPKAAVKIAMDMYEHKVGNLTAAEALKRVSPRELDLAQQSILDPKASQGIKPDWMGIPASSGVVSGKVVLSSAAALKSKEPCILVTMETTPNDILGMNASVGILTMTGGATSHAAVVARGMNKTCVTGLGLSEEQYSQQFVEGEFLTLDGNNGAVYKKKLPVIDGSADPTIQAFKNLLIETAKATIICQPDSMPTAPVGKFVLDVQPLLGMPTAEAAAVVKKAVGLCKDRLILDCSLPVRQAQVTMFRMMGINPQDQIEAILNVLVDMGLNAKIKLILGEVAFQCAAKFNAVGSFSNVEAALAADCDGLWVAESSKALAGLNKLLAKAGMPEIAKLDIFTPSGGMMQFSTLAHGLMK